MKAAESYIFVISMPAGAPTDPESLIGALEAMGVHVDLIYGAVPVNLLKLRYCARGCNRKSSTRFNHRGLCRSAC